MIVTAFVEEAKTLKHNVVDVAKTKDQIKKLYDAIKDDFVGNFLDAVAIDSHDKVKALFADDIIKAKFTAEENELVRALISTNMQKTLEKINTHKTNYADKLPENFGKKLEQTVKSLLTEAVNAKTIEGENAATLKTNYNEAEAKTITQNQAVYSALNDFYASKKADLAILKGNVTEKANKLVETACLKTYASVSDATNCKNVVTDLKSKFDHLNKDDFAKNKLLEAEKYISDNSVSAENQNKAADHSFYALKDHFVEKMIDQVLGKKQNYGIESQTKILANQAYKLMTLKSGSAEEAPGFGEAFYSMEYQETYTEDSLGFANKGPTKDFLNDNVDTNLKNDVILNKDDLTKKACEILKFEANSKTCDLTTLIIEARATCDSHAAKDNFTEVICAKGEGGNYSFDFANLESVNALDFVTTCS